MSRANTKGCMGRTISILTRFCGDRSGNFAIYGAISILPLMLAAGLSIDYTEALRRKSDLQNLLDAAVLAGAVSAENQAAEAREFFIRTAGIANNDLVEFGGSVQLSFDVEGDTLAGAVSTRLDRIFGTTFSGKDIPISVEAAAKMRPKTAQGPCITVLANSSQALLLNSGARIVAPKCEIHVHSTKDPAFIMNAGVNLDIANLCVKGTRFIRNGGTVTKLTTGCQVAADPYAGKIPEPTIPTNCQTSGARDGKSHTLNPGAHCNVNFNGSPTITFKPGLHIIRGSMNINSGSTVIAEGVTFYFADRNSKIQANGALTLRATAPTSGAYADILMFEKTSDAASNPWTQQFVFNGSNSEYLEGVIHLPYRDVTYNSTTNVSANKLSMIVNTLIVNSANWKFGPSGSQEGANQSVYLSR